MDSDQNYNLDIDQMFKDWIAPIDALRSYAAPNLGAEFNKLGSGTDKTDITDYVKKIKIETTPQESRCHAFYRLIGLPVVSNDNTIYSPGFDIFRCKGKKISKLDKLNIARNPIEGFNKLSFEREEFVRDNLKVFSNGLDIKAGLLALSSGGTSSLRKFNAPFGEKSDPSKPFDMDVNIQSYDINLMGTVGANKVALSNYKDSGGNKGAPSNKRKHIIKPFIVDARIDFTVMPQSKLIAVPFVPDDSFLKVSATENVNRPLIEKIIRDRLASSNPANSEGTAVDKVNNYIKQELSLTDNALVNRIKKINNDNIQDQFIDSLNIINVMVETLINAENIINGYQGEYYWVPVPSNTGPEGGVKVQGVFLPSYITSQESNTLSTKLDQAILIAYAKSITDKINADATAIKGVPNPNSYSITKTDFTSKTSSGLGDNNESDLESSNESRDRVLTSAGKHLRTIEIIIGEFSGLGLCDIVAITGALKILPLGNLYGLLDDDAYNRMKTALPTALDKRETFIDSISKLSENVEAYYNLMDSQYKFTKEKSKSK